MIGNNLSIVLLIQLNYLQYFLIIMVILVGECAMYAISWAWPHCLGLDLDVDELTKTLQRSYGVPGQEQFTAAIDLAQSTVSILHFFK